MKEALEPTALEEASKAALDCVPSIEEIQKQKGGQDLEASRIEQARLKVEAAKTDMQKVLKGTFVSQTEPFWGPGGHIDPENSSVTVGGAAGCAANMAELIVRLASVAKSKGKSVEELKFGVFYAECLVKNILHDTTGITVEFGGRDLIKRLTDCVTRAAFLAEVKSEVNVINYNAFRSAELVNKVIDKVLLSPDQKQRTH